ncbi:MAG: hypothetical protein JSV86_10465 [Gemmatimonadota bacterium]|nr:MAG: hypothetical protein JSV86_10465 [Gemmatimonadota bacterium]
MRVVYVAAPLGADTEEEVQSNLARALRWYRWACDTQLDCAFVMNWYVDILVYPGADVGPFRDANDDRQHGLLRDDAVIRACDEYWMVGGRVSGGMGRGRHTARQAGTAVVDLTHLGPEPPEVMFTVGAPMPVDFAIGEFSGEF